MLQYLLDQWPLPDLRSDQYVIKLESICQSRVQDALKFCAPEGIARRDPARRSADCYSKGIGKGILFDL